MLSSYATGWKKSFDYSGRATRSDFWWFVLVDLIIYLPLYAATIYFAVNLEEGVIAPIVSTLFTLYSLAGIFPRLSLSVRRMHDIGKGWFWILITLVPCIGGFWFLYLVIQPSIAG